MPIIELKQISKTYRLGQTDVVALSGIDLTVQQGELTVVQGPSGSGKTTLLNIIGCLDRQSAGHYFLEGKEVVGKDFDDLAPIRNEKIGFIFQSFNLIAALNVIENIEFPCALRPHPPKGLRERAVKLAEAVGLAHVAKHRPDELSGGQRQRVAIARALITEPLLVLADEPTANLDSKTSDQILELMLQLNKEKGVTFLFSTHDPRVVQTARRVVQIADGRLRA